MVVAVLMFGLVAFALIGGGVSRLVRISHAQRVTAIVADEEFHTDIDENGSETTSRFPVYEYEFNGQICRTRSATGGGKKIGEEAIVYITDKGELLETRTSYWLIGVGVVVLAGFIFMLVKVLTEY